MAGCGLHDGCRFFGSAISAVLPYFGLILCHTLNFLSLKSNKEQLNLPISPYEIADVLTGVRIKHEFVPNAKFLLSNFCVAFS